MPKVRSDNDPGYKRNRPKKFRRREVLVDSAASVIAEITADRSVDWTIKEIAEEAVERHIVPQKVYDDALERAVSSWLGDHGRRAKVNVGTPENPILVRRFAVYYIKEQTKKGEVDRPCWREWSQLTPRQHRSALHVLFKMSARVHQEAVNTFDYVNRMRAANGLKPLHLEDFTDLRTGTI